MQLDNLSASKASFDNAISNGFSGADPHAGKAVVLRDIEPVDYDGAIMSANMALTADANYQFEHDASMNWQDLRVILAQSYFATALYTDAAAEVTALGGTPPDPQSDAFVEDLLAEIERLSDAIGG
jgi:hypothetical protein